MTTAGTKYRKRPVVIEAVHYDGEFPLAFLGDAEHVRAAGDGTGALEIVTLEGTMRADRGDWIIRGVQGELYPCKPDIDGRVRTIRGSLQRILSEYQEEVASWA